MGYRAGIGASLASFFGARGPSNPHIFCDGCGLVHEFKHFPPAWFLNRKAKPGWKLIRHEDEDTQTITRLDYCPACKQERRA